MENLLQRETPITGNNKFTATEFITWLDEANAINIFWGNDTLRQYNNITVSKNYDGYEVLNNLLSKAIKEPLLENKNTYIDELISLLKSLTTDYSKMGLFQVYTEVEWNYNKLYHHLWKLTPENIIDYCPVNDFWLIVEWHNMLLQKKINDIGISSLMLNGKNEEMIDLEFAQEMLEYANGKINDSRNWYKQIYGNDGGNSWTKYPIKELKIYAEWLEVEKINKGEKSEILPTLSGSTKNNTTATDKQMEKSFHLLEERNKIKRLDLMRKILLEYGKVLDQTTRPIFRNVFSGKKISLLKGKIIWTGTNSELKYFINSLIECSKIHKPNNIWQISVQLFASQQGEYTTDQLHRNTKPPSIDFQNLINGFMTRI